MDDALFSNLPDRPNLERLGSALWNDGQARGAAVLVGAGFSRNAEPAGSDTRLLPLWSDLARAMTAKLYGEKDDQAPRDPLRLAEEFRTYFGQAVLMEFLRDQVPDVSWRPGELHGRLMGLPWVDVLTTNYDTLLERASPEYRVVRHPSELSQVKGRRIVKLHGCITGGDMIIAEEDYRTYPIHAAGFVNTARQVFLENELCLVGFSGDDPNFLQWSGWVRDHLGGQARRIYLVGSLGLGTAKRRLLESRGVAPIDFAPLTKGLSRADAERKACALFLDYLASRKPKGPGDWDPVGAENYSFISQDAKTLVNGPGDEAAATEMFAKLAETWGRDRATCPSWVVVPAMKRSSLAHGSNRAPWKFVTASARLSARDKWALLTQAAWRRRAALEPLGAELRTTLLALAAQEVSGPDGERTAQLRALLADARLERDEAAFRKAEGLLAEVARPGSDDYADLVAQRLLWARDGMELETIVEKVYELEGPDPTWRLLKASLHCDCGEVEAAKLLLAEACRDLEDRRFRDPRSVAVATRGAWADVFRHVLSLTTAWRERERGGAAGFDYDPWDELDWFRREIRSAQVRVKERPVGLQPEFGPGNYKDHGRIQTPTESDGREQAAQIFRLADAACIPVGVEQVDLLRSMAEEALVLEPLPSLAWHLRLARVVSTGSMALERHFGRIAVACMDADVADQLVARITDNLRFWAKRQHVQAEQFSLEAVERARVSMELLSRLIVRAGPEQANTVFRLALDFASDSRGMHYWLYEPVGRLVENSVSALSPAERSDRALQCLAFPLPPEGDLPPFKWPDPVSYLFSYRIPPIRPVGDVSWRSAVSNLLVAASGKGVRRQHAANRLAYLVTYDALETEERERFAAALWRSPKPNGMPADVTLYYYIFASMPAPANLDAPQAVRNALFGQSFAAETAMKQLHEIAVAADIHPPMPSVLPSREEAKGLLRELIALQSLPPDSLGRSAHQLLELIGRVLGLAVLPCLHPEDLTADDLNFIKGHFDFGPQGGAIVGLHEISRLQPGTDGQVALDLRRVLARGTLFEVFAAVSSIVRWAKSRNGEGLQPLPALLVDAVVSGLATGGRPGLHARLACARELFAMGALSPEQVGNFAAALVDLAGDLAYVNMPLEGAAAVGLTLARTECVRCAAALTEAGVIVDAWEADVQGDPLPEVRFASEGGLNL